MTTNHEETVKGSGRGPVICLGSLVADLIAYPLRSLPGPGQQVLVDSISLHTGGCASNVATALARLGIPVAIIAKAGVDPLGDFVVQALADAGVDVRGVRRVTTAGTSTNLALVDRDGERRFVHTIGANAALGPQDVDAALLRGASILYVGGALVLPGLDGPPLAGVLRDARAAGVVTLLDIIWDDTGRWMEALAPSMPYVDYFLPNLLEGRALTGQEAPEDVARSLVAAGAGTVILKLGAEGCLVVDRRGELWRVPARPATVVDATGAGDCFAAGLIAGLWHGWSLRDAVRLGHAVGAACVAAVGATTGVGSWDEMVGFR